MTYEAVKKWLHDYIEHGDENKVMAIYTLLNDAENGGMIKSGLIYDEATLDEIEQISDDMASGKEKTYTLEETIANIQKHRKRNAI